MRNLFQQFCSDRSYQMRLVRRVTAALMCLVIAEHAGAYTLSHVATLEVGSQPVGVDVVDDELFVFQAGGSTRWERYGTSGDHRGTVFAQGFSGVVQDDGDSTFNRATNQFLVVMDDDGNSLGNDRIVEFNQDGSLVRSIDINAPGDNSEDPRGIAHDVVGGRTWLSTRITQASNSDIRPLDLVTAFTSGGIGQTHSGGLEYLAALDKLLFVDLRFNSLFQLDTDGSNMVTLVSDLTAFGLTGGHYRLGLSETGDLAVSSRGGQVALFDSSLDGGGTFDTSSVPMPAPSSLVLAAGMILSGRRLVSRITSARTFPD